MSAQRVLHIGFQKTGTTWFQQTLGRNRTRLAGRLGLVLKGPETMPLMRACLAWIESPDANHLAAVSAAAEALSTRIDQQPEPVTLISDENLIGRNVFGETGHMVDWACALLPTISRALGPERTTLVCHTREPSAWIASVHNQAVKIRRETRELGAFRAALPFALDWSAIIHRIADATGGPMHSFAMEQDLAEPLGPGAGLLRWLGLEDLMPRMVTPKVPPNRSLGRGALNFLLAANRSDLRPRELANVRRLVLDNRALFATLPDEPS